MLWIEDGTHEEYQLRFQSRILVRAEDVLGILSQLRSEVVLLRGSLGQNIPSDAVEIVKELLSDRSQDSLVNHIGSPTRLGFEFLMVILIR
jgi:hypothetical protein